MIDKYLRPVKEKMFLPTARWIGKYLTPNQISIIAFFFGLISCVFIFTNLIYPALLFWLLNRIIDGLDGTVARISKRQTDWGGYLDIMLDFIIYALIPISFTIVTNSGFFIYISLSIMLAVFYINSASWMYLSAVLEKRNVKNTKKELTTVTMPTGLIEGTETIFTYTLFFIFSEYLPYIFLAVSGLTIIGIIQRMIWGYKNL
jgi:phosphatidylglycerophosphate synthase